MAESSGCILGMRVDATSYGQAVDQVLRWAANRTAAYVCVSTVHMVMEAYDSPGYRRMVNAANLVTPDGVPLVWCLRWLGYRDASRVYGPDLTALLLRRAAEENVSVGFYGGVPLTLERITAMLRQQYPSLRVAYAYAPPFRPLTEEEDGRITAEMNACGVQVLFVGLGCPKQERWMADHTRRVRAVLLGVGAAFDFLTKTKPQAPRWMMSAGLEWLFRLATEPKRLWRRYLKQNPRFVAYLLRQRLGLCPCPEHGSTCPSRVMDR